MKQVVEYLLCDWHDDGVTEGKTIPFEMGKERYELDLCADCRAELKAIARRVTKRRAVARKRRTTKKASTNGHVPASREVREWAASQKIAVSPHGRIPNDVMAQYEAANS